MRKDRDDEGTVVVTRGDGGDDYYGSVDEDDGGNNEGWGWWYTSGEYVNNATANDWENGISHETRDVTLVLTMIAVGG